MLQIKSAEPGDCCIGLQFYWSVYRKAV